MKMILAKNHTEKLIAYWAARSDRERKLITLWSMALAVMVVLFGIVMPMQNKIATLQKRLPELEKQLQLMRVQSPASNARPGNSGTDLRSQLFEILAREKITADIRTLSNGHIELRLPAMTIQDALAQANSLKQETQAQTHGLQISHANDGAVQLVLEMGRE